MRVLHVVGSYPTNKNPEKSIIIKSQIESLNNLGIKNDVLILRGKGLQKYLRGLFIVKKKVKTAKYDLIHSHYSYCAFSSIFQLSLPLVISFMGNDIFGDPKQNGHYPFFNRVFHRILSIILSEISQANILKSQEMQGKILKRNCFIIPNGVNSDIFFPINKEYAKEQLMLKKDCKYILFVGGKNDNVKNFEFARSVYDQLKLKIPNLKLLRIYGLRQSILNLYYNAVDILILTSFHEGSPNVIKEAMACNLPIVANDVGDVKEWLKGVKNCYVLKLDISAFTDKTYKLIVKNERSNGRNYIKNITSNIIAEKIFDVYLYVTN